MTEKQKAKSDFIPIVILLSMYSIQGILFGYFGSTLQMIFSEKPNFDYASLGILSLSTYPFSFKLIFAPFLDIFYSHRMGKRKTYIIPTQILMGILFINMGYNIEYQVEKFLVTQIAEQGFILMLLTSLQDISVDAWALQLLSVKNVGYASSLQSVGVSIGILISDTLYLESKKHFPLMFSDKLFFVGVGVFVLLLTVYIYFYVEEDYHKYENVQKINENQEKLQNDENQIEQNKQENKKNQSLSQVLRIIKLFFCNSHIRFLIFYNLFKNVGITPIQTTFRASIVKGGITKEYISDLQLFMTPFKFIMPIVLAKLFKNKLGLIFGQYLNIVHILLQVFQYIVIQNIDYFKDQSILSGFLLICIFQFNTSLHSLSISTRQSFYGKISQKGIEATYITCLSSVGNLGYKLWSSNYLFIRDYIQEEWLFSIYCVGWISVLIFTILCQKQIKYLENLDKKKWEIGDLELKKHKQD